MTMPGSTPPCCRASSQTLVGSSSSIGFLPTLAAATMWLNHTSAFTNGTELGNLYHALNWSQIFGIWPTGDFRVDPIRSDVTGVLIASPAWFAQILEGPSARLDELMASIRRDPRHTDVEGLMYDVKGTRRFAQWSLGYCGSSAFIDTLIEPLADRNASKPDIDYLHHLQRLLGAMVELTRVLH